MKLESLVGERFKERPADCVVDSHALMIRGGYIKQVGNGIYTATPILKRITKKIEQIMREEMDKIEGQEVQFPVAMPASLWEESGRYASVGPELMRFTDRNDTQMVLGMTHEEPAVHLVREYGQTYQKYPFMIYQIQTKFRDEARPRAGLIRVREFTMKDGYSFHISQDNLNDYYDRCHQAYERIYSRVGVPDVVSVKSDSGMMGGSVAHEFMLLTAAGEDTIVVCESCDFRANLEATERIPQNTGNSPTLPQNTLSQIEKKATPDCKTINDVCSYLKLPIEQSCKAVIYQKNDNTYVVVFIRGDLEINETKLRNFLGSEIQAAIITPESGLHAGYTGPYKLTAKAQIFFDRSLEGLQDLCCGANEEGYHYTGLSIDRDVNYQITYNDFAKVSEGDICPKCSKPTLNLARGIEVGNIFQLGDKYTKAMGMQFADQSGTLQYPIMGCYGIGVERLAASICEAHHDDHGPIWPMGVAPWQVHLCCVRADDPAVKEIADKLYDQLQQAGIEVIYDDRVVSAGVMFSDADLLGVPIRVICSPRNLKEGICEIVSRDKTYQEKVNISKAIDNIHANLDKNLKD